LPESVSSFASPPRQAPANEEKDHEERKERKSVFARDGAGNATRPRCENLREGALGGLGRNALPLHAIFPGLIAVDQLARIIDALALAAFPPGSANDIAASSIAFPIMTKRAAGARDAHAGIETAVSIDALSILATHRLSAGPSALAIFAILTRATFLARAGIGHALALIADLRGIRTPESITVILDTDAVATDLPLRTIAIHTRFDTLAVETLFTVLTVHQSAFVGNAEVILADEIRGAAEFHARTRFATAANLPIAIHGSDALGSHRTVVLLVDLTVTIVVQAVTYLAVRRGGPHADVASTDAAHDPLLA
jgi:hypothetical protein